MSFLEEASRFNESYNSGITRAFDAALNKLSDVLSSILPQDESIQEQIPNYAFHIFILLFNVAQSTPNLILWALSDNDVHVIFWLGVAPSYVNMSVPFFLLLLNVSFWLMTLSLNVSYKFVSNFIMIVFTVVGLMMIGASLLVGIQTWVVADSLWYSCGHDPLTAKIQSEWDVLAKFQAECIEEHGEKGYYIQQCPGFGELRKGRETYVDYIEDIELDYTCQGFCTTWARPLFDPEMSGDSCASAIGSHVANVGAWIAIPTMITGQVTLNFGSCLSRYKHV
jgi:hypothetical protein